MSQPQVKVGIMSSPAIRFVFPTAYSFGGQTVEGAQEATLSDGKVLWGGALYDSVEFTPCDAENGSFELIDVTIGVNFHWERKENQSFRGSLRIIVEGDKLTAVNILPIEEYLLSVISSEMSATASLELLKAHAVISRSWLLAQIEKNKQLAAEETPYNPCTRTEGELVRWYDREDHVNFDVCADDHCQRYQGITRESTATVRDAIKATWGQVLTYDGTLCDARFSKSCGGVFEQFETAGSQSTITILWHGWTTPTQWTIPPYGRGKCPRVDTFVASRILQHHRQAYPLAGAQQLRPGDHRLLPMDGGV